MSKYHNDIHGCTGLLAGNLYGWQRGMRYVVSECSKIWGMRSTIHTPVNGYAGWEKVADSAIMRKPKRMLFPVHSNGGKFATFAAKRMKDAGCSTEIVIIMFDRTLGRCEPLGSNVIAALDMHYDKSWLERGDDFNGTYEPKDFRGEPTSHIRLPEYKKAQDMAFAFAERWRP
jgi:hypothetical protein